MSLHLSFSVPFFVVPLVATCVVWLIAILWPVRSSGGAYDFGGAIDGLFHGFLAMVGTILIWIAAFIALSWAR